MAAILNCMFYKKPHKGESSKLSAKTMLVTVSLRYPLVIAYICINICFFLKTNERIGFLISESISIDILFMSVAYVVAKLFVNKFIFIYAGGHLGFRHCGHFLAL